MPAILDNFTFLLKIITYRIFSLLSVCLLSIHAHAFQTVGIGADNPSAAAATTASTATNEKSDSILLKWLNVEDENKLSSEENLLKSTANTKIKNWVKKRQEEGYFGASIDSVQQNDKFWAVYFYKGNAYKGLYINTDSLAEDLLRSIKNVKSKNQFYTIEQWEQMNQLLLRHAQNNGYPFAETTLKNVQIDEDRINASLDYNPNQPVKIDSVILRGKAKISRRYMENYLNLKRGDLYNEQRIAATSEKLKALSFVKVNRDPAVEFYNSGARVYLFMNKRNASKFDFLLGLLPSTETGPNARRFQITGEALLSLQNVFGEGERLHFEYNSYPQQSRNLDLEVLYPYLPVVPFGVETKYNLFISDTTFINRNFRFGLHYALTGNNYIKVFFDQKRSGILTVDTSAVIQTKMLPENLDWTQNAYGISAYLENLDYAINPTRGNSLKMEWSLGNRTINLNSRIINLDDPEDPSFNYESLYDTIDLKTLKSELKATLQRFWPIGNQSTILTQVDLAYLWAPEIFDSELYRIGGYKILRGFDEQSVRTINYQKLSLEYRYLIGRNSYFLVFGDWARTASAQNEIDFPLGFGGGLNFETNAGVFGLYYALGRRNNNPIDLRSGKIHFGYASYF